jgi:hypothetical protein
MSRITGFAWIVPHWMKNLTGLLYYLLVIHLLYRFRFFSAKLVRTITFLSFQIGQLYLVYGCMTIRRCVAYKLHIMSWIILFKKQLFDLEVKDQGSTKVIMVRDTPPYGHAPTYEISLTYLERQKSYDSTTNYLSKTVYFFGSRLLHATPPINLIFYSLEIIIRT